MKNILFIIFIIISNFIYAQSIPILDLRSNIEQIADLPLKLEKNDLCVILQYNSGWSAYDKNIYYIFKTDGNVIVYQNEFPKEYLKSKDLKTSIIELKISESTKNNLIDIINSRKIIDFQKFNQSDFKINKKPEKNDKPERCMIYDAGGYSLKFIQNNKQNTYNYHAPRFYLEKCEDKSINKSLLKEYVEIVETFESIKLE